MLCKTNKGSQQAQFWHQGPSLLTIGLGLSQGTRLGGKCSITDGEQCCKLSYMIIR